MRISEFAVKRKVTVLMGVLVVLLLGSVAYGRLPIDLFPDFSYPAAAVITSYGGAAPSEVEDHVTRPIEQALATVTDVTRVRSSSGEGMSVVTAEFSWGTAMDFAALEMREKVDQVRRFFPADAGQPMVVKFDPSLLPVMLVSLSGGDDAVALRELGDTTVRERLERLPGVAAVSVSGGATLEVAVEVDDASLAANGVSWAQLRVALRSASVNLPGGRVTERGRDFLVRSIGRLEDLEGLRELVVGVRYAGVGARAGPRPVRLGDVATVSLVTAPDATRSRLNGLPSLVLSVQKTSRGNTVAVAGRVVDELNELQGLLPEGADFEVTMNQAEFIGRATGQVTMSALWGAGLAVLVLLAFLLNLGSVTVIALAIPVSVVATMVLLYFSNLTLNLMTLSGLALGVGMLVDNSIVVLENITRHVADGEPPAKAAVAGAAEVVTAITASTLTTLAVFLPVVFVGGIAGTLFRDLALTVSFALGASLLVAITFVPAAAAVLIRPKAGNGAPPPSRLGRAYSSLLGWALRNRWQVVLVGVLALVLTYGAAVRIGGEFLPRLDRGEFMVTVQMPPGTTLDRTDAVIQGIEELAMGIPEVRYVTSTSGTAGAMAVSGRMEGAAGDTGTVTVKLAAKNERTRPTREVMADLERQLWVPGARISVEELTFFAGSGFMKPIEVSIRGSDLTALLQLSEDLRRELAGVGGLVDLDVSVRGGRPEVRINYDRDRLAAAGLSPIQVAEQVKGALAGEVVGSLAPAGNDEVDVVLRYVGDDRDSLERIRAITIVAPAGAKLRLDEVATITEAVGPTAIEREANQRVISLTAQLEGRDLGGVMADVRAAAARLDLPAGYEIAYGGEGQEMAEAFAGLGQALYLAVILVYMVMAAQFESLLYPLVIMFSLPLAAFGATAALYLTGKPYSVSSIIGLVLLAGIVVNNSIVLVDYLNQLRRRGLNRDVAITIAGRDRLRPILMTTLTTILAMVPLALNPGEGAELAAPMAIAVIGGLGVATLLTLVFIPVVYSIADDLANRRGGNQPDPLDASDLIA